MNLGTVAFLILSFIGNAKGIQKGLRGKGNALKKGARGQLISSCVAHLAATAPAKRTGEVPRTRTESLRALICLAKATGAENCRGAATGRGAFRGATGLRGIP